MPDYLGQVLRGYQAGQGIASNRLAGEAFSAAGADRQSALGRLAGVNPQAAMTMQGQFQQQEVDHAKKINGAARYMLQAVESKDPARIQGAWTSVAPYLSEVTGKPIPPGGWNDSMLPGLYQTLAATGGDAATATDAPSGYREFQLTAQAAGLKPGTPEYQQAANIALGREGRASNAGIGFQKVTGADGRERIGRTNPRTGAFEVYNEQSGQFEPMGSPMLGGQPQAGATGGGVADIQAKQQALLDQANLMVKMGADPKKIDQWLTEQTGQISGMQVTPATNPGLAVGRAPEDTEAAKEAARQRVELGYLPQKEAITTAADIERAKGKAQADTQAAIDKQNAERSRDARSTLALLDEAEKLLPNATGSTAGSLRDQAAASVGVSTAGAQATAQLQTIAGQLTSKMPRMQGPQSDKDVQLYKQMAGDLANPNLPVATRMAALRTIRSLNQKYANDGRQPAPAKPTMATGGDFSHLWGN